MVRRRPAVLRRRLGLVRLRRLALAIVFFPLFRAGLPSVIAMSSPGFFRRFRRTEGLRRATRFLRGGLERLAAGFVRLRCAVLVFRLRFVLREAFAAARWRAVPKCSFCFSVIRFAMFFAFLRPDFRAGFAMIVSI
jgi:hypothetical protein